MHPHSTNLHFFQNEKGYKYLEQPDSLNLKSGVFIITVSLSLETNRKYDSWELTKYWMRW